MLVAASLVRGSVAAAGDEAVSVTRTLFVSTRGEDDANGVGTVTVTPPGAVCPPTCELTYENDPTVTLRAAPGSGSFLYRWETCPDFDLDATCTFALTQPETDIAAVFLPNATLQVGVTGNDGLVTLSSGDECETSQNGGAACNFPVAPGSSVTLTPNAVPGSTFVGWSVPECPGTGRCTMVMDSRVRSVMATFNPTKLSVITSNEGIVRSAESPAKINCGSDVDVCSADSARARTSFTAVQAPTPSGVAAGATGSSRWTAPGT